MNQEREDGQQGGQKQQGQKDFAAKSNALALIILCILVVITAVTVGVTWNIVSDDGKADTNISNDSSSEVAEATKEEEKFEKMKSQLLEEMAELKSKADSSEESVMVAKLRKELSTIKKEISAEESSTPPDGGSDKVAEVANEPEPEPQSKGPGFKWNPTPFGFGILEAQRKSGGGRAAAHFEEGVKLSFPPPEGHVSLKVTEGDLKEHGVSIGSPPDGRFYLVAVPSGDVASWK